LAFGIFEPTAFDAEIASMGLQVTESELEAEWVEQINALILNSGLEIPAVADKTVGYGGRQGKHTEYLAPLLNEMTEVFIIDPAAAW
jgi:ring-1,2-phenylacetyl-CoA epoxidase subunit PaaC